ncbi:MAG: N-acetyltransferase [Xanthomonadales bacterium]|nr:GNAT family N-acetyltransferase [Gammaproteobacteria bacterium]NNL95709.1 N-acetyltransferase [Xanthomonadales bacterium]
MNKAPRLHIRHAEPGDLPAVLKILNHYILHDHCTFDTEPWSVEQKQPWFVSCSPGSPYQLLVAILEGKVAAYAHSSRWRPKNAYDITVETTVYVSPAAQGQGIGMALMERLLSELGGQGLRSAVAGVTQPNPASDHLHLKLGFKKVGTFEQVGYKFGNFHDVTWYRRRLD